MAIPLKGSRRIVIDAVAYRWSVRKRTTYSQALEHGALTFAVEREESGLTVLVVTLNCPRPRTWFSTSDRAVTPALVERAVREALAQGWSVQTPGSAHLMSMDVD